MFVCRLKQSHASQLACGLAIHKHFSHFGIFAGFAASFCFLFCVLYISFSLSFRSFVFLHMRQLPKDSCGKSFNRKFVWHQLNYFYMKFVPVIPSLGTPTIACHFIKYFDSLRSVNRAVKLSDASFALTPSVQIIYDTARKS